MTYLKSFDRENNGWAIWRVDEDAMRLVDSHYSDKQLGWCETVTFQEIRQWGYEDDRFVYGILTADEVFLEMI